MRAARQTSAVASTEQYSSASASKTRGVPLEVFTALLTMLNRHCKINRVHSSQASVTVHTELYFCLLTHSAHVHLLVTLRRKATVQNAEMGNVTRNK